MINKWITNSSEQLINLRIFDAHIKNRTNPGTGQNGDFVVLNSQDWVNIIPITKNKDIVMIEQYRHGSDSITIEIPGGLMEKNELPRHAAERECIEETGYSGFLDSIQIGESLPNPAFLNNKCSSFVWFDCENKFAQNLDLNEDINVLELSIEKVKELIANGKINHSVILTAFFFFFLKYDF